MSDGTLNFPERSTSPDTPTANRVKLYNLNGEPYYIDDTGANFPLKGTDGTNGTNGTDGTNGTNGIDGAIGPAGPMNVDGFIDESNTVNLPNSTTPTLVYSNTVTITATADIFILAFLAVSPHSVGNDVKFDIEFDGVALTPSYVEEHKDTSNDESMWRMGLFKIDAVTAGSKDIDLYFSKEATGGTAELKSWRALVVRY